VILRLAVLVERRLVADTGRDRQTDGLTRDVTVHRAITLSHVKIIQGKAIHIALFHRLIW